MVPDTWLPTWIVTSALQVPSAFTVERMSLRSTGTVSYDSALPRCRWCQPYSPAPETSSPNSSFGFLVFIPTVTCLRNAGTRVNGDYFPKGIRGLRLFQDPRSNPRLRRA